MPPPTGRHTPPRPQSWLLDGFPRTIEQAQALESANIEVAAVLSLDVPDNEIIRRVGGTARATSRTSVAACAKNRRDPHPTARPDRPGRYVHVASGRVYNLEYNPPKKAGFDDLTGEPLVKREDDDEVPPAGAGWHRFAAPRLSGGVLTRALAVYAWPPPQKNIRKRLDAFHATAAPLLKYYEKKGLLKRFGGKTSDEIYAKVQPELTSLLGGK